MARPVRRSVYMFRGVCSTACIVLLSFVVGEGQNAPAPPAGGAAPHAYFEQLVARPEHWKSYSLRDPRQLATRENGGYANSNSRPLFVTYDPAGDPDPRRQDAAKVVITTEGNSLRNQVRPPMGTEEGHSYLVTWDAWFGDEYRWERGGIPQQKTFQFSSGGIWFEIQTRFNLGKGGHIGQVTARGYNRHGRDVSRDVAFGPNVTDRNPLPMVGEFIISPERWTRYWALIEQRKGDYDLVSLWVADEQTDPVHVLDRLQLKAADGTIDRFYLEYNTSTSEIREGRPELVSYVRNLVMLRDVANPTALMVRPLAGGAAAPPSNAGRPGAVRNLRTIAGARP